MLDTTFLSDNCLLIFKFSVISKPKSLKNSIGLFNAITEVGYFLSTPSRSRVYTPSLFFFKKVDLVLFTSNPVSRFLPVSLSAPSDLPTLMLTPPPFSLYSTVTWLPDNLSKRKLWKKLFHKD